MRVILALIVLSNQEISLCCNLPIVGQCALRSATGQCAAKRVNFGTVVRHNDVT